MCSGSTHFQNVKLPTNKLFHSLATRNPQRHRPILAFRLHRQIEKWAAHPLGRHPIRNLCKRNPFRPKSKNIPVGYFFRLDPRTLHLQRNLFLVLPLFLAQRFFKAACKRRFPLRSIATGDRNRTAVLPLTRGNSRSAYRPSRKHRRPAAAFPRRRVRLKGAAPHVSAARWLTNTPASATRRRAQ